GLKAVYLRQLRFCLDYRWVSLGAFALLVLATAFLALPRLGREFMPELEEGNLWIRGTFPINASLGEVAEKVRIARAIMAEFGEVEVIMSQVGRPDDGTDPPGFYTPEFFVPLKPPKDWPVPPGRTKPRTKPELIEEMSAELSRTLIGVDWDFSQVIRDNVMEALSGVKGENSIKIFGPDLDELERIADEVKNALATVPGIQDAGVFRIKGQSNLEMQVDRAKCSRWGINVADVNTVIETAVRGKAFTQMIEGEKSFDVTLRWPERLRRSEYDILQIPVDVINNTVTAGQGANLPQTPLSGPSSGVSPSGTSTAGPAL